MYHDTLAATAALIRDTFREAFARKIFWGFFGCATAIILFFIFLVIFVVALVTGFAGRRRPPI